VTDIQGIVTFGYRDLKAARFVLGRIGDRARARAWLGSLAGQVTPATKNPDRAAINVGLTSSGLAALGLEPGALEMFPDEFRFGMTAPHRQQRLGDVGESSPDRWAWGGSGGDRIDVVLMLFASDAAGLQPLIAAHSAAFGAANLTEVQALDTVDLGRREHFGYHDGISQPIISGLPKAGRPDDTVATGEFVLGHPNEYGFYTPRPLLAPDQDPGRILPADPEGSGRQDLGRNGTYLVFRQLEQHVDAFHAYLAAATRSPEGGPDAAAAERLGAKMVGRWTSGAPLVLSPDRDDPSLGDANDFRYHQADPLGLRCPIGSHVRRANPRDSLDPRPGSDTSVAVGRRHRILRRGRSYGDPGAASKGLYFMCVCASIARQFEFVQQTWVNNPKFAGLYDDADPLLGVHQPAGGTFTVPAAPVRRRWQGLPRFVTVRGGAYFFLPGLRALRYLGS
jgi:Dyp-type peroxidase family